LGPVSAYDYKLIGDARDSEDEFNRWMRERGGVDVNVSFIRLVITGERRSGVLVTGMRADILVTQPPLHGALFFVPSESEGRSVRLGFNLDEEKPVARVVSGPDKNYQSADFFGPRYFDDNNISLEDGERHVIDLVATTTSRYHAWRILMDVHADGHTVPVTIGAPRGGDGNNKPPFEITALERLLDGNSPFRTYDELYVLDDHDDERVGFVQEDPATYIPDGWD
jgi:hypothetical protein